MSSAEQQPLLTRLLGEEPSRHPTFEAYAASYHLWLLNFSFLISPAILVVAFAGAVLFGGRADKWSWLIEPAAVFVLGYVLLRLVPGLRRHVIAAYFVVYGGVVVFSTQRYAMTFGELELWLFITTAPHIVTPMLLRLRTRCAAVMYLPAVFTSVVVVMRGPPSTETLTTVVPALLMSMLAALCAGELLGLTARANWQHARELAEERDVLEKKVVARTAALNDLTVRIAALREQEREDLARDLHDQLSQVLTGLRHHLFLVRNGDAGALDRAHDLLDTIHDAVRDTVVLLGGAPLVGRSLRENLRELVDNFAGVSDAQVALGLDFADEPDPGLARAMLSVVRESLTNIRRHAASARRVDIAVTHAGSSWTLRVTDDGDDEPGSDETGIGLRSMRARVEQRGGRLVFTRGAGGAVLEAVLPVEGPTP